MKNRSFRRWLTLVLVLAMLLGILPAVAARTRRSATTLRPEQPIWLWARR